MEAEGVSKKNEQEILGGGDVEVVIEELNSGDDKVKVSEPEAVEENDQNGKENDENVDDDIDRDGDNVEADNNEKVGNEVEHDDTAENEFEDNDQAEIQNDDKINKENEEDDKVETEVQNDGTLEKADSEHSDKEEEKEVEIEEDMGKNAVEDVEDVGNNAIENDDYNEKERNQEVQIDDVQGVQIDDVQEVDVQEIEIDEVQEDKEEDKNKENENGVVGNQDILKERDNEIDIQIIEKDDTAEKAPVSTPITEKKKSQEVPEKHIPNGDDKKYNNKENDGLPEQNNNTVKDSISKFGAPVQRKEKGMFKVVQTEKCAACQKTVYAMEKLEMNGHIYHKNCFKCSHCSARLTAKTFSMNEGVIYCVNHFKQLFARKGNYDEGFGRQQYKKRWQGDKSDGATA